MGAVAQREGWEGNHRAQFAQQGYAHQLTGMEPVLGIPAREGSETGQGLT